MSKYPNTRRSYRNYQQILSQESNLNPTSPGSTQDEETGRLQPDSHVAGLSARAPRLDLVDNAPGRNPCNGGEGRPEEPPVESRESFACDILLHLFSIVSYIVDVGSDVAVAVIYYHEGDRWWFVLTVLFIVVPSITITLFSLAWYIQDRNTTNDSTGSTRRRTSLWIARSFILLLQLGPILRYCEAIVFGVRYYKANPKDEDLLREKWYIMKVWEDTDSALLRLFESFMEAAPQLTLQLYIISVHGVKGHVVLALIQGVSCATSLCSTAWALVAYQRALRLSRPSKAKLRWFNSAVMFLWLAFVIGARVLAFALFASIFEYWLFVLIINHWILMFVWILIQKTNFCTNRPFLEVCFDMVAAAISIFCFFNLLEGPTRLRYLIYYVLVYLENLAMIVVWHSSVSTRSSWYITPAMVAVLGGFFLGICFQLVYYLRCHPNNLKPGCPDGNHRIELCVPWKKLVEHQEFLLSKTESIPIS